MPIIRGSEGGGQAAVSSQEEAERTITQRRHYEQRPSRTPPHTLHLPLLRRPTHICTHLVLGVRSLGRVPQDDEELHPRTQGPDTFYDNVTVKIV